MIRAFRAMFVAASKTVWRDRQTLVGVMIAPFVFLLAFAAFDVRIESAAAFVSSTEGVRYFDFALAGILGMGAVQFSVFWTSGAYARLAETGALRRLQITPVPRLAFLTGQVGARLVVVFVQTVLTVIGAMLLGGRVTGDIVALVCLTTIAAGFFMTLGFAIGARARNVDAANMIAGMLVTPLVFLSGAWFPTGALPDWLRTGVEAFPLAAMIDAMRSVVLAGGSWAEASGALIRSAIWMPPAVALAVWAMSDHRRRTVEQGPAQDLAVA